MLTCACPLKDAAWYSLREVRKGIVPQLNYAHSSIGTRDVCFHVSKPCLDEIVVSCKVALLEGCVAKEACL